MAIVANVKHGGYPVGCVYIGRRNGSQPGSVLGNPFVIGADGSRADVVAKYRAWLWAQIKLNGPVLAELKRIQKLDRKTLRLVCWCAPLACHGDVILKALEWLDG